MDQIWPIFANHCSKPPCQVNILNFILLMRKLRDMEIKIQDCWLAEELGCKPKSAWWNSS